MNHRRILRWEVPVDDEWHWIGGGPVVYVNNRPAAFTGLPPRVEVWTEELVPADWPASGTELPPRRVCVFGTGHAIPGTATDHLGSVLDGPYVWHLYAREPQ